MLAIASQRGRVQLVDGRNGGNYLDIRRQSLMLRCVSFSNDGLRVLCCGGDSTPKVFLARTGENSALLRGHEGRYGCVCKMDGYGLFSPAVGEECPHQSTFGHAGEVEAGHFSPDGMQVATAGRDGSVIIWDRKGAIEKRLDEHTRGVRALAFSTDGELLASGGRDTRVVVWCASSGGMRNELPHPAGVGALAFAEDSNNRILASGCDDAAVRLWNSATGDLVREITNAHPGGVTALALSQGRSEVVSGGNDMALKLWCLRSGGLQRFQQGHDGSNACTCVPARHRSPGQARPECASPGHRRAVTAVALSPDGLTLASGSADGTCRLWDIGAGEGPCLGALLATVVAGSHVSSVAFGQHADRARRLAFALALAPRAGKRSYAGMLEPGLVRMVLDQT